MDKVKSSRVTNSHHAMGYAKIPQNFLKKHSKDFKLPNRQPHQYKNRNERKPPIPKFDLKNTEESNTSKKNFIVDNVCSAIKSVPQIPTPYIVDTRMGSSQSLARAGIYSKYIDKKDYGKVPYYLKKRKKDFDEAQEMFNNYIVTRARYEQSTKQIQEDEKQQLLKGLRENWQELNSQYLSMSLVIDSFKKKLQKEMLEHQMKLLEKCIETLQNDIIYVSV